MTHRTNHGWCPDRTDPAWAAKVEAEAVRHTAARELAYQRAARRLARAEARLEAVRARQAAHLTTRAIAVAEALVEVRRQEMLDLQRLMTRSPAGATHRGTDSFRPVPEPHTL